MFDSPKRHTSVRPNCDDQSVDIEFVTNPIICSTRASPPSLSGDRDAVAGEAIDVEVVGARVGAAHPERRPEMTPLTLDLSKPIGDGEQRGIVKPEAAVTPVDTNVLGAFGATLMVLWLLIIRQISHFPETMVQHRTSK